MQMDQAEAKRRAWKAAGAKPCDHDRSTKERYLGTDTGDRVCLDCGVTWFAEGPKPGPLAALEELGEA